MKKIYIVLLLLSLGAFYSNAIGQKRKNRTKTTPQNRKTTAFICKETSEMGQLLGSSRKIRDVIILDLSGRIANKCGGLALESLVTDLIKKSQTKILLNLGKINFSSEANDTIKDSFTKSLVNCFTTAEKVDGRVKILSLTKSFTDLLFITKILTVFDCFDNEADAITSFY